jgi:hypothetical protein
LGGPYKPKTFALPLASLSCFVFISPFPGKHGTSFKNKTGSAIAVPVFGLWAMTDSNRRPSACKADALNQLS